MCKRLILTLFSPHFYSAKETKTTGQSQHKKVAYYVCLLFPWHIKSAFWISSQTFLYLDAFPSRSLSEQHFTSNSPGILLYLWIRSSCFKFTTKQLTSRSFSSFTNDEARLTANPDLQQGCTTPSCLTCLSVSCYWSSLPDWSCWRQNSLARVLQCVYFFIYSFIHSILKCIFATFGRCGVLFDQATFKCRAIFEINKEHIHFW